MGGTEGPRVDEEAAEKEVAEVREEADAKGSEEEVSSSAEERNKALFSTTTTTTYLVLKAKRNKV